MTRKPQRHRSNPHHREKLLRQFIEHTPAAVAMFDREMRYVAASRRFLLDYDLGERDLTGQSHYDVFPEIPERWKEIHRRCLAGASESCEGDPFPRADGRLDWIRWDIRPWYDAGGGIGGIILFSEVITDRKLAQQVMQETTARFASIFRSSPVPITLTGAEDGRFVDVNDAACALFGYSREELLGHTSLELGIVDPAVRRHNIAKAQGGRARNLQTPIFTRGGERREVLVSLELVDPGSQRLILATSVDITDRLRAEEALRKSEERLRLALDAAHMGTFDWDVSANRITWSRWHEELWGYAPGEFGGTYEAFSERVHPDDLPAINAEIEKSIAGRTPFTHEFRVVWPDGSMHWVIGRGEFTFDSSGAPLRMNGVVVETTVRKRAEAALRESERRLRLILDGLGPQMFAALLDVHGVVLLVNRPALEALGVDAAEIVGRQAWDIFVFDRDDARDRVRNAIERAARGESVRYDEQIITAGREPIWIDFCVQPLRDETGEVAFLVPTGLVINERKIAEQKLEMSSRQLRALLARLHHARESERIRMSREIHDELGQLLTSLKMDVRWLEGKLRDPAVPPDALLDRLVGASELVDTTIATVQTIAAELRSGLLDRLGLEASLAEESRQFQERTGVRCSVEVHCDEPVAAGVANELFYISQECLTNVARHARADRVDIRLASNGESIVLEVADDGVGIAGEQIEAPDSLGLLGMKERAALCGGTISFRRREPRGTSVTVRVPVTGAA